MTWKFACHLSEIPEPGMREIKVDGVSVLFLRADGQIYATPPLCPHMDEPLADGICEGGNLICMRHFWQWNLRTGEPQGDAEVELLKYKVKVESNDSVHVFIDEELYYD